jgi:hypothetical protein
MFVVFGLFDLFVAAGKPMWAVSILFLGVICIAGLLGMAVARFISEPANRAIRERWQIERGKIKLEQPTGVF